MSYPKAAKATPHTVLVIQIEKHNVLILVKIFDYYFMKARVLIILHKIRKLLQFPRLVRNQLTFKATF